MIALDEARRRVLDRVSPLPAERVPIADAFNRVARETLTAPLDLPAFDNSAMDGYAVRAADLASATPGSQVRLRLVDDVPAGARPGTHIHEGDCVRVYTGSILPEGADAVVMQEDCKQDGLESVLFCEAVKPFENFRFRGEDIRQGDPVLTSGRQVRSGDIALLGAMGIREIAVGRRPKVALLATGSELREGGEPLEPGQIYESNRAALSALARKSGALVEMRPLVKDDLPATRQALSDAFATSDVVVTSGGVSVGAYDFVKEAFEGIGGAIEFWKVAVRPGKPFVLGTLREKLLLAVPGNPVSAAVTFVLLAQPALWKLQGASETDPVPLGILGAGLSNRGDRPHFVRVQLQEDGRWRSSGEQGSHRMKSMARAAGLVEVAPGAQMQEGELVRVLPFG